jgi:hypothetical protein
MNEVELSIARKLLPRDWTPLVDVVLGVGASFKRDLDLVMINRYVHEEVLELMLVRPDGTTTEFSKKDCAHLTISAPFHRAEGVRVEPYQAGQYLGRLATSAADWQPPAADRLEPSQSPQAEQQSEQSEQQSRKEREPTSGDVRASKRRRNSGGGAQRLRARVVLKRLWPNGYPTEEEVSTPDLWKRFGIEYDRIEGKANPPSKLGMPSPATVLREVGRKD